MLGDASPTPFDLRFRLFGFPIRVHPLFWLIMALLGDGVLREYGPVYLVVWVACGFVSILVHELGHAIAMRGFGQFPQIVLHGFGGYAVAPTTPRSAVKRLIIAFAGPLAGFLLFGIVVAIQLAPATPESRPLAITLDFLAWMNLIWSLFNLLPIWPLDGGRVCRELCVLARMRRPEEISLTISLLSAGSLAALGAALNLGMLPPNVVNALPFHPSWMTTLFMALFAYQSYELLQAVRQQSRWQSNDPWNR